QDRAGLPARSTRTMARAVCTRSLASRSQSLSTRSTFTITPDTFAASRASRSDATCRCCAVTAAATTRPNTAASFTERKLRPIVVLRVRVAPLDTRRRPDGCNERFVPVRPIRPNLRYGFSLTAHVTHPPDRPDCAIPAQRIPRSDTASAILDVVRLKPQLAIERLGQGDDA